MADTGWFLPGGALDPDNNPNTTDYATADYPRANWSNRDRITAYDAWNADVVVPADTTAEDNISTFLTGHTFGINTIPLDATIDGIEVRIRAFSSLNYGKLRRVSVSHSPSYYWETNDKKNLGTTLTGSVVSYIIGGPTDLWGSTTFTPLTISKNEFRVGLVVDSNNPAQTTTVYVDTIEVKVYYTESAATIHEAAAALTSDATVAPIDSSLTYAGKADLLVETFTTINGLGTAAAALSVDTVTDIVGTLYTYKEAATALTVETTVGVTAFAAQYITCHNYAFQPAGTPETLGFVPSIGVTPAIPMGQSFAIRWSISEDAGTTETDNFRFELYARLNGGTWDIAGVGDVPIDNAPQLRFNLVTTERMTTGQTFVSGYLMKNTYTNCALVHPLSNAYTELGFCLSFNKAQLDIGDVIDLKLRYRDLGTLIWQDVDAGTTNATVSITLAAGIRDLEQVAFRGRNDDGGEIGATWIAATNTDFSQAADTPFRLRFQVDQKSTTPIPNFDAAGMTLEYRHQTNLKWDTGVDLAWVGDINFSGPFEADHYPYSSFGTNVAISGNGEVIAVGSDHYPSTSTSDTRLYIYRWNSGNSTYEWEASLAMEDWGADPGGSERTGWQVELNYAGDMAYINNSHIRFITGNGFINVWQYSGGSWSGHSKLFRIAGDFSYSFGGTIYTNVAGTVVLAYGSYSHMARYTWNSGTSLWDAVLLSDLGVASGDIDNLHASPNLETIIFENGIIYKWSGSAYVKETDGLGSLVAARSETMRFDNDLTKLFTRENIGYQDTSGFPMTTYAIKEHELNTDYTSKAVNDYIYNTFDETVSSYDVVDYFEQRYDVSDDHTVLVVSQPFHRKMNKGHSVRVYRKKANSWHSINPQHGAPVVYSSKEVTTTGTKHVYNEAPTTQQISAGGTFEPAPWSDDMHSLVDWPKSGTARTEVEFCLQINSEFVATNDLIDFRVVAYNGDQDNERALETYTNTPTITVTDVKAPSIDVGFRGRDDDGNETAATWLADADTQFLAPIDTTFRLRSLVKEEGLSSAQVYHLQYNYDNEEELTGKFVRSPKKSNSNSESFSERNVIAVSDDGNVTVEGYRFMTNVNYRAGGIICNKWNASSFEWDRPSTWVHISSSANYDWGAHVEITSDGTKGMVSAPRYDTVYASTIRPITIDAAGIITVVTGGTTEWNDEIQDISIKDDLERYVYSTDLGEITTKDEAHNTLSILDTGTDIGAISLSGNGKVLAVVRVIASGWNVELYDWHRDSTSWIHRDTVLGSLLTHDINGWYDIAINTDGTELFFLTGGERSYHTNTGKLIYTYERNKVSMLTYNGTVWSYTGIVAYVEDTKLHLSKNCQYLLAGVNGVGALFERTWVWNNVENSGHGTAKVMYDNSTFLTDKEATTQQLGSGAFIVGDVAESQWPATTFTATVDEESEHEHVLQMPLSRIGLTDPIRYRMVPSEGTAIEYNVYPYLFPLIIFPEVLQRNFRGRNDDGWEDTATWKAPIDTNWTDEPSVTGRIRFVLDNTASVNVDALRNYNLQYNKNHDGTFYIPETPTIVGAGTGNSMRVAISGDGLVMAIGNFDDKIVSTYDKQSNGTWLFFKSVSAPLVGTTREYGRGLALNSDGTILYVGDPKWDDGTVSQQGRVWRYTWNGGTSTWDIDSTVIVADWLHLGAGPQVNEYFGMDVAISAADDVMVIGAPGFDYTTYTDSGCVYLYKKEGGTWETKGFYAFFVDYYQNGFSVALSSDGTRLAMGSPQYDLYSGAVWFANYESGSWGLRSYGVGGLTAGMNFGESVTMDRDGRVIIIGAPLDDWGTTYTDSGSLFIYDYDGGNTPSSLTLRHTLSGNTDWYYMGRGVALASDAFTGVMCGNRIQYNINSILNWTDIGSRTDTSLPVRFVNTTWLTDKEASTQQISIDTNFYTGQVASLDTAAVTYTDIGVTELEYAFEFYLPQIINTDVFKFRVRADDIAYEDEITYDEIPTIAVYTGLNSGSISLTVETTLDLTASVPKFGEVNATIDTIVFARGSNQNDKFGLVAIDSDTTVQVAGAIVQLGTISLVANASLYNIPGRIALRGSVNISSDTKTFMYAVQELTGVVDLNINTTVNANAINYTYATFSESVDTEVTIKGGRVRTSLVTCASDCSTTIIPSTGHSSTIHLRNTCEVRPTGHLTKHAKCGIIGETSVDLLSYNIKYVNISLGVDTETLIVPALFKATPLDLSSSCTLNLSGTLAKGGTADLTAHVYISLHGYTIDACVRDNTLIEEDLDITDISQLIDVSAIDCGE